MPFLWSGTETMKQLIKQLTKHQKPSPTNQNNLQDSARNSDPAMDGAKNYPFNFRRFIEKASLSASFAGKAEASMTVEAAIVLPLFLFFFLNLGSIIEMIRLHGNLQLALWQTGSELSVYAYALDSGELPEGGQDGESWWKDLAGIAVTSVYVKSRLVNLAGEDYLARSPLSAGVDSLQLWESEMNSSQDEIDIIVTYSVSSWSSLVGFPSFRMANRYYSHIWNGYQLSGETGGQNKTKTVFVAENAEVYHLNGNCTHLQLSVRQISAAELSNARNQYGRRYEPCEKCSGTDNSNGLFVTRDGNCYHYLRDCPGLKRTVSSMGLEEAEVKYRPCSRCG